ncbi:alpha-ketoglutarate-dependent dioxygenase AlkB [Flavilitoribacter nigricans]|uniref:2OG-Fe(II) oxygenase n=1 Tax=Flavilitoribacter nigricans (strain ATCC 23147 / DSM 23189 / NBRC 102662 / NCIMB 1420 / SS-2) TaxID=1122177 RepID=A0A2D0N3S7_FLAN2|nr:alpha-ketoglutarate-dependent dioxygenase AlkB [Flavilitoribacter nigricans]PHN02413.1 2OG-Fe(II) oxygenase [Flavilitoribacter nigricans DSM 23189 = NBRC 102662]
MSQLDLFAADQSNEFEKLFLDSDHFIEKYHQVDRFKLDQPDFAALWREHPDDFHEVVIHGKRVPTPRWQQAYGKNYEYTGSRNNALPIHAGHQKYLQWCQENIHPELNSLLINWYDGSSKHYIGRHRDSTKGLVPGTPIVTISHGETRIFRFRPFRGEGFLDFPVVNGDVLIIPWDTNKHFTHEVPHFTKYTGRRISVTLRAYGS